MKDLLLGRCAAVGCLALCCLLGAESDLRGEFLLNGSFESPDVPETKNYQILSPGEVIGEGWVSDGYSLVYHNRAPSVPMPLDGDQALGVAGAPVYQDVVLPGSTSFRLTFQLASDEQTASEVEINVLRNGVSIFENPHSFTQPVGAGFETFELVFSSASADSYRIWVSTPDGVPLAYADAFSLNVVPEPSTLLLLSLGVPLFLVTQRKRSRARRGLSSRAA
jgi:hypothetical protein